MESSSTQYDSIFEKLGGRDTLHDIVENFYDKVMSDTTINYFFEGVNMDMQRAKMKAFLMMALDGPIKFTGKDVHNAHTKLVDKGLNDNHFDAVANHIDAALEEFNIDLTVREEISNVIEGTRDAVLNRDF